MTYLLGGAAVVGGYFAVVAGSGTRHPVPAMVLFVGVSLSTAVALLVATRRALGGHRTAWGLLATAQLVDLAADVTFYTRHDLLGLRAFPSVADALYALHYPLLIAGLVLLVRRRSTRQDRAAVVDATVLAIAAGLLTWIFIERPNLAPGLTSLLGAAVLYQPLLDTVVLGVTFTLVLHRGGRSVPLGLLVSGVSLQLATNCFYGVQQSGGEYLSGGVLDVGWLTADLLLGACALHPDAAGLGVPDEVGVERAGRLRLGLLAVASLAAPVTLVLQERLGGPVDVTTGAMACALLSLLVLTRVGGLLAAARAAAVTDDLTGLANRARFLDRVRSAMADGGRADTRIAVLFLDVDRFKMINDALGHTAGDELLRVLADRLRGCLRAGDVAARHGGDSFTALLTGLERIEEATEAAERVRAVLSRPVTINGQRVECSVSVGVTCDVRAGDSADDLLRHADAAVFRAKDGGRNRVSVFDQSSRDTLEHKLVAGVELRDALEAGQIVAWFQPIVEMATGRIVGAEALARWIHPVEGVLAPGRFLQLAQDIGIVSVLSRSIALQTMDLRRDLAPLVDPAFRLSFNLGIGEFNLVQIVDRIMIAAVEHEAPPSGLTLEILETAVIEDVEGAGIALALAREAGFAVALDDFGTGYSSLSLLRDLPLDTIKIDRSFVQRMAGSPTDAAIVESILDLAGHLHLGVVAEGVETASEAAHLAGLGATRAQGYLYAPAVPAEKLTTWLREGPPWASHQPSQQPAVGPALDAGQESTGQDQALANGNPR